MAKTYTCNTGGCVSTLILIFGLWALWFGLPTFWGELEIDLFGPAIRLDGVTYLGN